MFKYSFPRFTFNKSTLCTLIAVSNISHANLIDSWCDASIKPMRVSLSHIEGKGVGYKDGYTSLEAFLAYCPNQFTWMPFVDLRGHLFDNGRCAANAGLGLRAIIGTRIYGANVYYDYRRADKYDYNQVSAGLECLSQCWDLRINGYLPLGSRTHLLNKHVSSVVLFNSLSGNHALIQQTASNNSKFEYAMAGFDAEVAYHVFQNRFLDLYAAVGPYYYNYHGHYAAGGRARVVAELGRYLRLEAINTYDNRFHEIFQGRLTFTIPFGPKGVLVSDQKNCNNYALNRRLVQNVERQEIIVLSQAYRRKIASSTTAAVDPTTGLPYEFYFVNNTSSSGNGTFEHPFPTLAQAEGASGPSDIIYVFPGDSTVTGMDAGIILQDNQQLLGASIRQTLLTTLGPVVIPAQASAIPIIGNSGGDVVTVANNNTLSGLYIQNLGGNGVGQGAAPTINNLTMTNNILQGSPPFNGVNLANVTGTFLYANNDNTNQNTSILITNSGIQNANYLIQNSIFNTAGDQGFSLILNNCSGINTLLSGNNAQSPANFLDYQFTSTLPSTNNSITCIDNTFYGGDSFLNSIISGPADVNVYLARNSVMGLGQATFQFNLSNGVNLTGVIENNEMYPSNISPNIRFDALSSTTELSILDNNFLGSANTQQPINISLMDTIADLQISGNQITGALDSNIAVNLQTSGATQLNSTLSNNSLSNCSIQLNGSGSSTNLWNVFNNTFYGPSVVQNDSFALGLSLTATGQLDFVGNVAIPIQSAPGVATYQITNNSTGDLYLHLSNNIGQFEVTGTGTTLIEN